MVEKATVAVNYEVASTTEPCLFLGATDRERGATKSVRKKASEGCTGSDMSLAGYQRNRGESDFSTWLLTIVGSIER